MAPDLFFAVISLPAVLCTEAGAINGNGLFTNQLPLAHQGYKLAEYGPDLGGVPFSEISNGVVLGPEIVAEPHHLYVAGTLLCQFARRADAIEVAVKVKGEQQRRMVIRSAIILCILAPEVQDCVVDLLSKSLKDAHRSIGSYEVLQAEDGCLQPVGTLQVSHKELFRTVKLFALLFILLPIKDNDCDLFAQSDVVRDLNEAEHFTYTDIFICCL